MAVIDPSELELMRAELDALDRSLLETAARRLEIVRRIGELKAEASAALFHRDRERSVLDRARVVGAATGIDPGVAERLIHVLIEASHDVQEMAARIGVGEPVERRRVLVVGGRGAMGRRFVDALSARGHVVDVRDRDDARELGSVVSAADVVMIAVPMHLASEVARQVVPHVRDDALVCDINSLKAEICSVLEAARGEAVGLHPMFGPTVASFRRQKVVFCPVRPGPLGSWLKAELGRLGCEIVDASPLEHDRMMAIVQVLVHFRTLVMGEALRRTGVPIEQSLRFTSPIYRLELAVVGRIFAQDADLYASIEMDNPLGPEVRAAFVQATAEVQRLIESGDRDEFRAMFRRVADYFDVFGGEAMRLSDLVIRALVSRA